MLEALKDTPYKDNELSKISLLHIDDSIDVIRKLIIRMYGLKGESKRCNNNLNKFRVKLATCKDSRLFDSSLLKNNFNSTSLCLLFTPKST